MPRLNFDDLKSRLLFEIWSEIFRFICVHPCAFASTVVSARFDEDQEQEEVTVHRFFTFRHRYHVYICIVQPIFQNSFTQNDDLSDNQYDPAIFAIDISTVVSNKRM